MRITKISVKGLFGMFDHEIPLNQESRITIVHGPNGVGKTVLMQMVHGLFHRNYHIYKYIPFEQVRLEFSSGASVSVDREGFGTEKIRFDDGSGTEYDVFEPSQLSHDKLNDVEKKLFPDFRRVEWQGEYYWIHESFLKTKSKIHRYFPLEELHNLDDVIDQDPTAHSTLFGDTPHWFSELLRQTETELIHTLRLQDARLVIRPGETTPRFRRDHDTQYTYDKGELGVEKPAWSEDVFVPSPLDAVELLDRKFESLKIDQMLDARSQSRKLAEMAWGTEDCALCKSLQSAAENITDQLLHMEFFRELELFEEIINERLLFKTLSLMSKNVANEEEESGRLSPMYKGIEIISENGEALKYSALSSGEQQLLVLYFQLLFDIAPDTLVMIDEPELSMNVVWQRNFLKDLQRIIELRKFDVLIATHSPQIIHDKWDWVVHLGEKVDD